MNDKTLKIRIKLHSTGTPVEPLSAHPDENKQQTITPPISENGNPKRLLWLGGLIGLAALLLFSVYVFNGKESVNLEKSASVTDHKPADIVREASAESPTQNPAMNEDSVAFGSQESENQPSTAKPAKPANIGSGSQPKLAKSDTLDAPSEKASANANRDSLSSETMIDDANRPTTPSVYAALDPSVRNHDAAEGSLSEDNSVAVSGPEDKSSTLAANNTRNESKTETLSEHGDKAIRTESTEPSSSHVARAQFTRGIEAREPIDHVEKIFRSKGKEVNQLYYFTELRDMKGDSVVHRWNHQGNTVANITFNINGDRWRVYSSKYLPASMKGRWKVVVTDSNGKPLVSESFIYD